MTRQKKNPGTHSPDKWPENFAAQRQEIDQNYRSGRRTSRKIIATAFVFGAMYGGTYSSEFQDHVDPNIVKWIGIGEASVLAALTGGGGVARSRKLANSKRVVVDNIRFGIWDKVMQSDDAARTMAEPNTKRKTIHGVSLLRSGLIESTRVASAEVLGAVVASPLSSELIQAPHTPSALASTIGVGAAAYTLLAGGLARHDHNTVVVAAKDSQRVRTYISGMYSNQVRLKRNQQ